MMLRENKKYTKLEAKILDMALVLHMDHGGGNDGCWEENKNGKHSSKTPHVNCTNDGDMWCLASVSGTLCTL